MRKGLKKLLVFVAGGFFMKMLVFFMRKKNCRTVRTNWLHFMHAERRELRQLIKGREGWRRYADDAGRIVRDYFLPHQGNHYHPRILRRRQLAVMAIALLFIKIMAVGYVFFVYPNDARLSEITVNRILELTNKTRLENGQGELRIDPALAAAAQSKAEDMIRAGYFAHYGPDGKKPWDWIDREAYQYLFVGENLAMNFTSAESAHEALLASPSHQANILNERWRDVGFAVVTGEMNGQKTTVLVELFAVRKTTSLVIAANANTQAGTTPKAVPAPAPIAETKPAPAIAAVEKAPVPPSAAPAAPAPVKPAAPAETTPDLAPPPLPDLSLPSATALPPADQTDAAATADREEALTVIEYPAFAIATNKSQVTAGDPEPDPNLSIPARNAPVYHNAAEQGLPAAVIKWSQWALIAGLLFIISSLLMHMVYRAEIEHKSVVIDALLLSIFVIALISTRLHLLESIGEIIVLL